MKNKTKHKLTTATVAVLMVLIAMSFTDGYTEDWKDAFLLFYPGAIIWVWFRMVGFLRFKK